MAEEQMHPPVQHQPAKPTPAIQQVKHEQINMQRLRDKAYDELMTLSESIEDDFADDETDVDRAEEMLECVMRCGTYADAAKAIRHFVCFMHGVCETGK